MCLATVYLTSTSYSELFLESVASLEMLGNKLILTTIFGETKEVEASIKKIDFRDSNIILLKNTETTALA